MAIFSGLADKLSAAFKKLRGHGKLSEKDVREGMREIKLALLEADVSFAVVKDFIAKVTERAVGSEVLESLVPEQQIVKIVNEELTALMGGTASKLEIASRPPTVILMVGLQGAGKTTHTGKLANMYRHQGKHPLLVACDVYRPAAISQLQIVGEKAGVPVFTMGDKVSPVDIAVAGVEYAKKNGLDMVFIDTAGRLHIDERMMEEIKAIRAKVSPTEVLLTVDSMTGQDAVNAAKAFNDALDITGVIMTKLDGDTRGGAALSVKHVTGKPIKFIGTGEKLDAIEQFYPDRMASRILGMGDVLSLIEKAEAAYDEKKAKEMERKLRESAFTLDDYLDQFEQLKKMGGAGALAELLPGMKNVKGGKDAKIDEAQIEKMRVIILSMTRAERTHPEILNSSRRRRIAAGSGTTVQDVNRLLNQYEQTNKLMKQFAGGKIPKNLKGLI